MIDIKCLNDDIWYYTIKYISITNFYYLYLTCKYFNEMFSDDVYWKYLIIYRYPILYPKQLWINNYKELIIRILISKNYRLRRKLCFKCTKELKFTHKFVLCGCLDKILLFHKDCIKQFVCSNISEHVDDYICPFCKNYCVGFTGNMLS